MNHGGLKRWVLIVSPREDIHALAVAARVGERYGEAVDCRVFDPATYPLRSSLVAHLGGDFSPPRLKVAAPLARTLGPRAGSIIADSANQAEQELVPLGPQTSVWWRRYRRPVLHPDVVEPEFRDFCNEALQSVLLGAISLCTVYNSIDEEERADRKLRQLYLARASGLNVPRTLISTDRDEVTQFVDGIEREGKRVVYKHATAIAAFGMPTRVVDGAARARFDTLKYAPSLFQEEIAGGPELRIAVMGSQIFCCEWRGSSPERKFVDIKLEDELKMWPTELPQGFQEPLSKLQQRLGLAIGIYDFKLDGAGQPFFLEVNPSGQWLNMEIDARV